MAPVCTSLMVIRCLVLHRLRLMITEWRWSDIRAMGRAVAREVSECIAAFLAHVRAPGVSPLRVLTAWLSGRKRSMPLHDWLLDEICEAVVTRQVFKAHQRDIVPFIRTVGPSALCTCLSITQTA
uniref:Uncharacterized protein n=1 Tax=Vitrella brassicaformis TaxID=1169539 RepID=A0A7S1PC57_9ALVE|mmetsp:Transcript_51371/g.128999  ORF Transcript_51371/g.128999 Transcript_51371/m.128999 type:complete len:125 (+) Transcript_51371:300-674(+)